VSDFYYHTCGYPILFGTRVVEGETVPVFLDGATPEEDLGEPVTECPGCGEMLLLGDLLNELEDE
jgi:hypothetical protein